jgi:hypothetical protein
MQVNHHTVVAQYVGLRGRGSSSPEGVRPCHHQQKGPGDVFHMQHSDSGLHWFAVQIRPSALPLNYTQLILESTVPFDTHIISITMAILMQTSKPKILIPEKVSPDGLALLKDQFEVDERKGLSAEELKSIIGDYEALIVRSETKVTADLLNAAKKLKVVARAGVGVDNVR